MKNDWLSTIRLTSSHPPAVTVFESDDPTAVGETVGVIEQDVVQLRSIPLRVRRITVRLGSSIVLFHSTNQAVRVRSSVPTGVVAYVAFGPRAGGTLNGLPLGPDSVLACPSGVKVEFVVQPGHESVAFLLPRDELLTNLRLRRREQPALIPRGVKFLQADPGAGQRLFNWGTHFVEAAARQPHILDEPQANGGAQNEMFETLLSNLGSGREAGVEPSSLTCQTHSQIVQRIEDYALAHVAGQVRVADLCQAAGVSERTLQYAFRKVMGMTPIAYLTRLRLHRVRQALRASSPRSTTVTAEALRWGFWHFGDFSRAYNKCFGELPSETLRRR